MRYTYSHRVLICLFLLLPAASLGNTDLVKDSSKTDLLGQNRYSNAYLISIGVGEGVPIDINKWLPHRSWKLNLQIPTSLKSIYLLLEGSYAELKSGKNGLPDFSYLNQNLKFVYQAGAAQGKRRFNPFIGIGNAFILEKNKSTSAGKVIEDSSNEFALLLGINPLLLQGNKVFRFPINLSYVLSKPKAFVQIDFGIDIGLYL